MSGLLAVQRHIMAFGVESLLPEFAIQVKRHARHPNLVLLKYNQIASDFSKPIVRECRGIVLDEADGWRVVARAFDKFFNHGEGHAASIDWSTARVQEKLDGSLCTLYFYGGAWHVATTGTPDASGNLHGDEGANFSAYFWETFNVMGGRLPEPGLCYSFELTGPKNRVVVPHKAATLTLLSVRDPVTGLYGWPEVHAARLNIPHVRSFGLQSFDDLETSFRTMSPLQQEGYVIVDAAFNRVKVKHPGYVALHHAKDGMTTRAFVDIVRKGEVSEVINAFPEFGESIARIRDQYAKKVAEIRETFERIRHIESQKEFAGQAVVTPFSACLFQMRKGVALEEFIASVHVDKAIELLGVSP